MSDLSTAGLPSGPFNPDTVTEADLQALRANEDVPPHMRPDDGEWADIREFIRGRDLVRRYTIHLNTLARNGRVR